MTNKEGLCRRLIQGLITVYDWEKMLVLKLVFLGVLFLKYSSDLLKMV